MRSLEESERDIEGCFQVRTAWKVSNSRCDLHVVLYPLD